MRADGSAGSMRAWHDGGVCYPSVFSACSLGLATIIKSFALDHSAESMLCCLGVELRLRPRHSLKYFWKWQSLFSALSSSIHGHAAGNGRISSCWEHVSIA